MDELPVTAYTHKSCTSIC